MTSIPTKMKTNIFVTLLFVAVASASLDGASDDDGTGVCPGEYMRKHPEVHDKKKDLMKTYGLPDFSKLKSCSSDGKCDKDKKCCETPCGMKCMQPVFEGNALETIEQIHKEIGTGADDKPYEVTEEDKKYGMCPDNYLKTHPEIKEKMEKKWKSKHSHKECKHGEQCSQKHSHKECKHGEQCSQKHSQHKKHKHFRNYTAAADCSADGDCSNNMRCCKTMCGKKCVKPVFTNEDLKAAIYDKDEEKENRKKREVNEDEQDKGHDDEMEPSMEHGTGPRKAGERKGQGKGGDHGKGHGKGGKCGKGHGKGGEQGKGNRRGAGKGKGHGKGMKHGKGEGKAQEHQVQVQDGEEHIRQKRFINSGANEGDNGLQEGSQNVKGTGQDKRKGKGKKKGKGQGKGNH